MISNRTLVSFCPQDTQHFSIGYDSHAKLTWEQLILDSGHLIIPAVYSLASIQQCQAFFWTCYDLRFESYVTEKYLNLMLKSFLQESNSNLPNLTAFELNIRRLLNTKPQPKPGSRLPLSMTITLLCRHFIEDHMIDDLNPILLAKLYPFSKNFNCHSSS